MRISRGMVAGVVQGSRILFLGAALVLASATSARADRCEDPEGTWDSVMNGGPGCASPFGICTLGELHGDIVGTYEFAMMTMVPTGPGVFNYTGQSVITTDHGQIVGQDEGVFAFQPDGTAIYASLTIVSGTDDFARASGGLGIEGNLNLISGTAAGTYDGSICGHRGPPLTGGSDDDDSDSDGD